jgi:hypothetical protein
MKTYIDPITQKSISYYDNDVFIIKTRHGFNKKMVKKLFQGEQIEQAIKEFYALIVKQGAYKYLFQVANDKYGQEGELIFRMKGEVTNLPLDNVRLKSTQVKTEFKFESIGTLTKCPKTLSDLLAREDFTAYPASISRWTNSKLFYCLIAHFLNLPWEEKLKILKDSEKLLFAHKQASGYNLEEENKIKVDVVTRDDLL